MYVLLKNPEIKKALLKIIILTFLIALFVSLTYAIADNTIKKRYLERDALLLGKLLSDYPEISEGLALSLIRDFSHEEAEMGKALLDKYGISTNAYGNSLQNYSYVTKGFFPVIISGLFLCAILYLSVVLYEYSKIYKKISFCTDFVSDPESDKTLLPEESEGIIASLCHHINQLVLRQNDTFELLKRERVFLKNLVSDISHQLKTPLSSLIIYNDLLLKKMPDNDLVLKCRDQTERMEWLIISLLKYARLEADSVEYKKNRDLLHTSIENSIKTLNVMANEKKINIVHKKSITEKFLHDGPWLEEALSNIIKNSIEHTPYEGDIGIYEELTPLSVKIVIEDTGPGIPPEEISYIFDRFYKGKSETNPKSIGIGLSLSRLIIEGQGGMIRAENKKDGGARFTILFPRNLT